MIWMILSILIIYLIYYIWIIINFDKQGNQKQSKRDKKKGITREKKMPAEVKYFVNRYNVDLDKVNYRYFLQVIGLIVAIDVSIISSVALLINTLWLQIVAIIVLVIVLIFISFGLLGRYFKKKGLTKDAKHKRNRK